MNELLVARMNELRDLKGVLGLASWDRETIMPPKADTARGHQIATLEALYHERLVDPRLADWLENAAAASDDERIEVRLLRKERDRAAKLPPRLVKALSEAQSAGLSAWREARAAKNFALFRPKLEAVLALRREQADAWGHDGERYDALLEGYEPGMRVSRLSPVLRSLREQLVPLVEQLEGRPKPKDIFAGKHFDVEAQWAATMKLLKLLHFDLEAGRQDRSVHPFTGGTHTTDVRLTTRLSPDTPVPAIFGTIHECGHGLYEQGFDPRDGRSVLGQALSMGLHESQSRLWENLIGRSRPFWHHAYGLVQGAFPTELGSVSLDDWYAAINRVERTFIRVEADEVTYNLHIVLRYELELAMFRGDLAPGDVEGAWNEKTKSLLGLTVRNPLEGVLQDIHWAWGEFGYFPTYSLGNLYSASLLAAARQALPHLDESIAAGQVGPLVDWLRSNVHRKGARYDAEEVVRQATGHGLTDRDFMSFLKTKYGALYGLSA